MVYPCFYPETRLRNTYESLIRSTFKSILSIYANILKPSKIAKSQIKTDLVSLIKAFSEFQVDKTILEANQNEAIEFICNFTDDEMTGLSYISKTLEKYTLRDLKGLYLWNNKESSVTFQYKTEV